MAPSAILPLKIIAKTRSSTLLDSIEIAKRLQFARYLACGSPTARTIPARSPSASG